MKESINKEICRLAEHSNGTLESYKHFTPPLDILVRAMWAINRENKRYAIIQDVDYYKVCDRSYDTVKSLLHINDNKYYVKDNPKSALQSAIEYVITEQSK